MFSDELKRCYEKLYVGSSPFQIGDVVMHPSGRKVQITGGSYWGDYGISNFWYWREVMNNGDLGRVPRGLGWEVTQ